MRAINQLLIPANEALKNAHIVANGIVEKGVIEGHIAGFGAMVINIDLLPTVAVYMEDENRRKVIDAIARTLNSSDNRDKLFEKIMDAEGQTVSAKRLLKEKVMNASVALKMMIRTYKINKNNE
ncbi:hypothetical protein [Emticicia agri]|uniref:CRISPR type III-B/RAMP module-associated protein Cmr5 n=1 Tax=Emticicia agri TaxID=2492393 RepID=A0A4Q5LTY3_9BACT|nr:hypothetical protein [Emticicia agri]RYU93042.1 hypothetical protein EWM59_24135 [Emticicia agri]